MRSPSPVFVVIAMSCSASDEWRTIECRRIKTESWSPALSTATKNDILRIINNPKVNYLLQLFYLFDLCALYFLLPSKSYRNIIMFCCGNFVCILSTPIKSKSFVLTRTRCIYLILLFLIFSLPPSFRLVKLLFVSHNKWLFIFHLQSCLQPQPVSYADTAQCRRKWAEIIKKKWAKWLKW